MTLDRRHVQTIGTQLIQIPLLVLESTLADDVELAIVAMRPLDEPGNGRSLERREVFAGEVTDEVGRGEDGRPVDELHGDTKRSAGLDSSTVAIGVADG